MFSIKNTLVKLTAKERKISKKKRILLSVNLSYKYLVGSSFLILILTIFILKRYFILNVNVIEIQNIENKVIDN